MTNEMDMFLFFINIVILHSFFKVSRDCKNKEFKKQIEW